MPTPLALALLLLSAFAIGTTGAESKPEDPRKAAKATAKEETEARAARQQIITDRLLQSFTIGVEAPAAWLIETRDKNGCRFASNMQYLSGGVEPDAVSGDANWFFKFGGFENQIRQAREADVICWFTWYMLSQSAPSHYKPSAPKATQANAKVKSTMRPYWEVFKRCMVTAAKYPDVPIVMQIEPDEWGHLLIGAGFDAHKEGVVLVGGSGMPELAGIPDSVAGWAAGFRKLRDLYCPKLLLCANPSAWDREGKMSGQMWAKYFADCNVSADGGWDLFVAQLHDWDRGLNSNGKRAKFPPYAEADTVTYHHSWDHMCEWIKAIHDGTGLWCSLWQLPVGNATYCTCDGSDGHGCDGVAEQLLEDYPRNTVAARMAAAGCCMWIFSHGGGGASVWDARKDGVTNPTPINGSKGKKSEYADDDGGYIRLKAAEYFKNPVMILGKTKKGKSSEKADNGNDATADATAPKPHVATLTDKDAAKAWSAKLEQRIAQELADHRTPKFTYAALRSAVRVDALENGVLKVRMEDGGMMDLPWTQLKPEDLAQLAEFQVRESKPEDHALAGFFLMLVNRLDQAEDQFAQAGGLDAEVRKVFSVQ